MISNVMIDSIESSERGLSFDRDGSLRDRWSLQVMIGILAIIFNASSCVHPLYVSRGRQTGLAHEVSAPTRLPLRAFAWVSESSAIMVYAFHLDLASVRYLITSEELVEMEWSPWYGDVLDYTLLYVLVDTAAILITGQGLLSSGEAVAATSPAWTNISAHVLEYSTAAADSAGVGLLHFLLWDAGGLIVPGVVGVGGWYPLAHDSDSLNYYMKNDSGAIVDDVSPTECRLITSSAACGARVVVQSSLERKTGLTDINGMCSIWIQEPDEDHVICVDDGMSTIVIRLDSLNGKYR